MTVREAVSAPLLVVEVPGTPRTQGSMALMGLGAAGQPRLRYSQTTVQHRNLVVDVLRREWAGKPPLSGAVGVRCLFGFPRPKAHFGTGRNAGVVKASAPSWHTVPGDADKLLRLVNDALVIAGVLRDDAQVALLRGEKRYCEGAGSSVIEVFELP